MEDIELKKKNLSHLKGQLAKLEESRDEINDRLTEAKLVQAKLKEYLNPKPQKRSFMQMLFEKMMGIEKMEKGL